MSNVDAGGPRWVTHRAMYVQVVTVVAALIVLTVLVAVRRRTARRWSAGKGTIVELVDISDVRMGGRGTDFVNTWVEVRMGDAAPRPLLYLNDGGWFGRRALLTGSNVRIASAVAGLVQPPSSET